MIARSIENGKQCEWPFRQNYKCIKENSRVWTFVYAILLIYNSQSMKTLHQMPNS